MIYSQIWYCYSNSNWKSYSNRFYQFSLSNFLELLQKPEREEYYPFLFPVSGKKYWSTTNFFKPIKYFDLMLTIHSLTDPGWNFWIIVSVNLHQNLFQNSIWNLFHTILSHCISSLSNLFVLLGTDRQFINL